MAAVRERQSAREGRKNKILRAYKSDVGIKPSEQNLFQPHSSGPQCLEFDLELYGTYGAASAAELT